MVEALGGGGGAVTDATIEAVALGINFGVLPAVFGVGRALVIAVLVGATGGGNTGTTVGSGIGVAISGEATACGAAGTGMAGMAGGEGMNRVAAIAIAATMAPPIA